MALLGAPQRRIQIKFSLELSLAPRKPIIIDNFEAIYGHFRRLNRLLTYILRLESITRGKFERIIQ